MGGVSSPTAFQVDLRGMISLVGQHLYSTPHVFVRELLQNAVDAITARTRLTGGTDPGWGVRLDAPRTPGGPVRCVDDGVGMTLAEVGELLATVGRSSKRDAHELPISGYLGQFGIGMLSCFMVTDRITVRTRSVTGAPAVEWVGHSSGVFTAEEIPDDLPPGTTVEFQPRPDDAALTTAAALLETARRYGSYLTVPIRVNGQNLNRPAIWALPESERSLHRSDLDELGAGLLGQAPLATIPLAVAGTDLQGTAFVLPYGPSPSSRQAHRVYLNRMLVTEHCDDLLPDWAFFVRCMVTTGSVNPTASREQLVDDEALRHVRHGLGLELRRWIDRIGREQPYLLAEFVAVHGLALRSVASHDRELASMIVPWLTFDTSVGRMTLKDFLARNGSPVHYVTDHQEFDTVAALSRPDRPVLNAGYVYDAALLRDLPLIVDGAGSVEVTAASMLDGLAAPALDDQLLTARLERRATEALATVSCEAVVRVFEPDDQPSFLVADPDLWRRIERGRALAAPGLWSNMLTAMRSAARFEDDPATPSARLCLNWSNPMIRRLAAIDDEIVAGRILRVLYCQAAVAAHRPLRGDERTLLTASLDDLLALSLSEDLP